MCSWKHCETEVQVPVCCYRNVEGMLIFREGLPSRGTLPACRSGSIWASWIQQGQVESPWYELEMWTLILDRQSQPGLHWNNCGQQQVKGGGFSSPPHSHETPPRVLHPLWTQQDKQDISILEQVQRKVTRMVRRREHISWEERLRLLGMFSLERKPYWGLPTYKNS